MDSSYKCILENAIDFLVHSVIPPMDIDRKLEAEVNGKYTVLNLSAAVELFIKARLCKEHRSLIFSNSDNASKDAFYSGRFVGVAPVPGIRFIFIPGVPSFDIFFSNILVPFIIFKNPLSSQRSRCRSSENSPHSFFCRSLFICCMFSPLSLSSPFSECRTKRPCRCSTSPFRWWGRLPRSLFHGRSAVPEGLKRSGRCRRRNVFFFPSSCLFVRFCVNTFPLREFPA